MKEVRSARVFPSLRFFLAPRGLTNDGCHSSDWGIGKGMGRMDGKAMYTGDGRKRGSQEQEDEHFSTRA